jgi:CheY-like chemotaxis protein
MMMGHEEAGFEQEARRAPAARRLLVVDDNIDSAESLAVLMRLLGHVVEVAHESRTALEILERFRADVAILDIGMPGVDGLELARAIRKRAPLGDLLLVALSGFGREDDRRAGLSAGFDHYLVKPCDPVALRAIVDRAPRR